MSLLLWSHLAIASDVATHARERGRSRREAKGAGSWEESLQLQRWLNLMDDLSFAGHSRWYMGTPVQGTMLMMMMMMMTMLRLGISILRMSTMRLMIRNQQIEMNVD